MEATIFLGPETLKHKFRVWDQVELVSLVMTIRSQKLTPVLPIIVPLTKSLNPKP